MDIKVLGIDLGKTVCRVGGRGSGRVSQTAPTASATELS
jgi:hypothetical protein